MRSSVCRRGSVWFPGTVARVLLSLWVLWAVAMVARVAPGFTQQTGLPCAACHVGAFGPQLIPYGRDLKLNGYTAADGKSWTSPISATAITSLIHTRDSRPQGAARWSAPNDNFALDEASLYCAGRIDTRTSAYAELFYDGLAHQLQPGNIDIRHALDFTLFGLDAVGGVAVNNSPIARDLWNSIPIGGFPYNRSPLAPTPAQAAFTGGASRQRVVGPGLYAMWNDTLYTEFTAFRGVGRDVLNATGVVPVAGAPEIDGFAPYWRVAIKEDLERHFFQIGRYGMHADIFPGGDQSAGMADSYTDIAADANYQFILDPESVVSDMPPAHAVIIHGTEWPGAGSRLSGTNQFNPLDTFRADASYSFSATVTPAIQIFQTAGSTDMIQFGAPGGRPSSAGVIAEVAYEPWGKPDSPIQFLNLRFAVQYVAYTQFNGSSHGAAENNAMYFSLWSAMHF